jgi:hypothetical protein
MFLTELCNSLYHLFNMCLVEWFRKNLTVISRINSIFLMETKGIGLTSQSNSCVSVKKLIHLGYVLLA